jgi:hypothetical protein
VLHNHVIILDVCDRPPANLVLICDRHQSKEVDSLDAAVLFLKETSYGLGSIPGVGISLFTAFRMALRPTQPPQRNLLLRALFSLVKAARAWK